MNELFSPAGLASQVFSNEKTKELVVSSQNGLMCDGEPTTEEDQCHLNGFKSRHWCIEEMR